MHELYPAVTFLLRLSLGSSYSDLLLLVDAVQDGAQREMKLFEFFATQYVSQSQLLQMLVFKSA